MTCPPFSPPELFDLTGPNNPVVVWIFGAIIPLAYLISLFFIFRRLFRNIRPGPERRSLIWLQCLQAGCMGLYLFFFCLPILWMNALNLWSSSLPTTCYSSVRPAYFDLAFTLKIMSIISAFVLLIVGSFLSTRINKRYQRLRAALCPVIP